MQIDDKHYFAILSALKLAEMSEDNDTLRQDYLAAHAAVEQVQLAALEAPASEQSGEWVRLVNGTYHTDGPEIFSIDSARLTVYQGGWSAYCDLPYDIHVVRWQQRTPASASDANESWTPLSDGIYRDPINATGVVVKDDMLRTFNDFDEGVAVTLSNKARLCIWQAQRTPAHRHARG